MTKFLGNLTRWFFVVAWIVIIVMLYLRYGQ